MKNFVSYSSYSRDAAVLVVVEFHYQIQERGEVPAAVAIATPYPTHFTSLQNLEGTLKNLPSYILMMVAFTEVIIMWLKVSFTKYLTTSMLMHI